jgi:hypothetical protein
MLGISIAMILVAVIGNVHSMSFSNFSPNVSGMSFPNNGYVESNRTFDFEQSVQGNGYFMTYLYAKAGAVAVKNYAHGSGSLDSDSTLTYQSLVQKKHDFNADYNDFYQDCIQFKEDVSMVYAPMRIAVGNGYYAANPLDYSSLLKEKTWVKNYMAGTSMHHEVEYAHALDKELDVTVKDKINWTYDPELLSVGYTQMKVNEDVTDGKVHIGVLQANDNFVANEYVVGNGPQSVFDLAVKKTAWKDPAIEIDEDYWGTYHIEKNMTLEVPYYLVQKKLDWLPCCFGGYDYLNTLEKKDYGLKNAAGIFDCTCFKAPTQAQFPRVYNP